MYPPVWSNLKKLLNRNESPSACSVEVYCGGRLVAGELGGACVCCCLSCCSTVGCTTLLDAGGLAVYAPITRPLNI